MRETGVRGPLLWRMSKRISMIGRETGFLHRPPLMIIEPWSGPASRCRVTSVMVSLKRSVSCPREFIHGLCRVVHTCP